MDRCENLSSINMPNDITSIEYYAFRGCEKLTISWNSKTYTYENRQDFINDLESGGVTVGSYIWGH